MVPLLALGLALVALAVVPQSGRVVVLVVLAAGEAAFAVHALTADTFLVSAAALVAALLAIVVREMASTFALLAAPSAEARREREREHRSWERERIARERAQRLDERERRRADRQDRLAA